MLVYLGQNNTLLLLVSIHGQSQPCPPTTECSDFTGISPVRHGRANTNTHREKKKTERKARQASW